MKWIKKLLVGGLLVFGILGTSIFNSAEARVYTTTFPSTENPISEQGNWITGGTTGIDWTNPQETPGKGFGTQPGNATGNAQFADSISIIQGSWASNQQVEGVVYLPTQVSSGFAEVELLLRFSISAHSATGYEVNFSVTSVSNYVTIVRWNGALGNFTTLLTVSNASVAIHDNDIIKATISGSTITVFINGVQVAQTTDTTYATGNPGMGFFLQGQTGINNTYGFRAYTATDSAIVHASTCSQTDLTNALAAASDGNVVTVPPGTCTWQFIEFIPAVTITGSGVGVTNINAPGNYTFRVHQTHPGMQRITGISFTYTGVATDTVFIYVGRSSENFSPTAHFRFDHLNLNQPLGRWEFDMWGSSCTATPCPAPLSVILPPTGLIDHIVCSNCATVSRATENDISSDNLAAQNLCWTLPALPGTLNGFVYIEDSVFNVVTPNTVRNNGDANNCGRYVARFNDYIGQSFNTFEIHSVQGTNRGTQRWELYYNWLNMTPNTGANAVFMRAGSGVVFGNVIPPNTNGIILNNIRSLASINSTLGGCDGTATAVDGNSPDPNNGNQIDGWLCLDQVGAGYNPIQWVTPTSFNQVGMSGAQWVRLPAYFWMNSVSSTRTPTATSWGNFFNSLPDLVICGDPSGYQQLTQCWSGNCGCGGPANVFVDIVQNRDFFQDSTVCAKDASFCSQGVFIGTLATRPSSCVPGTGYWATDQGSWNTSISNPNGVQVNGADGILFHCQSNGTWDTVGGGAYVPGQYPHPYQEAQFVSASPPSAPTGVIIQ